MPVIITRVFGWTRIVRVGTIIIITIAVAITAAICGWNTLVGIRYG